MEITLTFEEAELLSELLETRHRDLLREISRSHHHPEFRGALRENAAILESVMNKVTEVIADGLACR
jgi:hypothetical protein